MSSTLSLSSSYVSSATNSFSDDIFGYVILTSTTVAVNSINSNCFVRKSRKFRSTFNCNKCCW